MIIKDERLSTSMKTLTNFFMETCIFIWVGEYFWIMRNREKFQFYFWSSRQRKHNLSIALQTLNFRLSLCRVLKLLLKCFIFIFIKTRELPFKSNQYLSTPCFFSKTLTSIFQPNKVYYKFISIFQAWINVINIFMD